MRSACSVREPRLISWRYTNSASQRRPHSPMCHNYEPLGHTATHHQYLRIWTKQLLGFQGKRSAPIQVTRKQSAPRSWSRKFSRGAVLKKKNLSGGRYLDSWRIRRCLIHLARVAQQAWGNSSLLRLDPSYLSSGHLYDCRVEFRNSCSDCSFHR